MDIKNNSHIGCVVVFIIAAICLSVYLARENSRYDQAERQKVVRDTTRIKRAWEIVDSIRHEQLMEDPDYRELYEEAEDLKDRLRKIRQYAEDGEASLDYFEDKGFDVSEFQGILDDIESECY